jgi:protein-tyrosine phosphatase
VGRHRRRESAFRVLFVCTGNICRSPFAEILARHLLATRLGDGAAGFAVASAGTAAVVGAGMHPLSRAELAPWGLDGGASAGFRARQLAPELVGAADLVLGLTPGHRSGVLESEPGALPIAFALREFARLVAAADPAALPADPVERAHALVAGARDARGLLPPVPAGADAVPDPIGRSGAAHHRAATLVRDAVATVLDVVAPGPVPGAQ